MIWFLIFCVPGLGKRTTNKMVYHARAALTGCPVPLTGSDGFLKIRLLTPQTELFTCFRNLRVRNSFTVQMSLTRPELVDQNPRTPNLFHLPSPGPSASEYVPTPVPQFTERESWIPFLSEDRGCQGIHESGHCGCCSKRSLSSRINDSNLSDADKGATPRAMLGRFVHSDGGQRVCQFLSCVVVAYTSVSNGWEVLQPAANR